MILGDRPEVSGGGRKPGSPLRGRPVNRLEPEPPPIVPGEAARSWMDGTAYRFAYRCTSLSIANSSGWEKSATSVPKPLPLPQTQAAHASLEADPEVRSVPVGIRPER